MIWVVKYIQEYDLIMTWCNSCLSINKIFTVTVALFYGTIFLRKCAHKIPYVRLFKRSSYRWFSDQYFHTANM